MTAFPPVPARSGVDEDRAAIRALLDRRAEALLERDRDAFMGTVADLSSDFVDRQRNFFRWAAGVDLSSYRYRVDWERYGDLARPSDRARYPEAETVSIPLTEERYRIRGYDAEAAVEDMYLTFVELDGEWLIVEDTDLDDLTLYSVRHLWDFGPVTASHSRHFELLAHPCEREDSCPATAHDYLGLAEAALQRSERYWTGPWRKRMVILVPDTQEQLSRMIQSTFDLDNFVAFAYSTVDLRRGVDYTGHRIILNPAAFGGRSEEGTLAILAHELVHIATRESAGPFTPIFIDEGFADYVGNDGDPAALSFFNSRVAAGQFSGELPEDFEFTVGAGTDIYAAYQESQSAVRFFLETWGLDRFIRFYRVLGRNDVVPGTVRHQVDRALRRTIGIGYDAFQRRWADSIEA